ncbi:MAG: DUF2147 domain-containing protein [Pseudomonadota bacterium]
MNRTTKTLVGAAAIGCVLALSSTAFAQSIVGKWKTSDGRNASVVKCGGSFCIKGSDGSTVGRMKGSGNSYSGTITDPSNNRTYSGSAKVSGNSMKLRGCALKVFCRTQTWRRR